MSQLGSRSFAISYQLMPRMQGNVVKRIAVIRLVSKEVSAPAESRDQTCRHFRFAGVQRCHFPRQRQRSGTINRMQFVTFGITSARSAPSTVGVFAVASHHQRLAVDDVHPTGLPQMNQMLFHRSPPNQEPAVARLLPARPAVSLNRHPAAPRRGPGVCLRPASIPSHASHKAHAFGHSTIACRPTPCGS